MASENGIVGDETSKVVENGLEKHEKDVELVGKEEEEQVVEDKDSEKSDGEKAEENSEEEEEEKKVVVKKRTRGSSVREAPVTPIERPSRERKTVERYMEMSDSRSSAGKAVLIEKGKGIPLKDIPNVAFKLSKMKPDENLKLLHRVLFGKRIKVQVLKRNIGLFSGFVWDENEEKQRIKVKERIDKCVKDKLLLFCDIFNIPVNNKSSAKKEDLSSKLLEFLESPHVTTEKLLADIENGKKLKRKAKSSKSSSSVRKASKTPSKKQKLESESEKKLKISSEDDDDDKEEDGDDEAECSESRDVSQEDDENDADAKEESDQDSKSEEEEEKNNADAEEESDQSKSEEEEENEKGKPKRQLTCRKSSSKAVSKNDSRVKTPDKSNSVKKTGPTKSSKTTPKATKISLMSTDDAEKNDTSVASGSSRKSKVPSTKKQKVDKEHEKDQSLAAKVKSSGNKELSKPSTKAVAKDQGNKKGSRKAKPEPSKEEMHSVVADILKKVDFNTATLSDILKKLGAHFDVDLTHRKAEVKVIITDVISNMTDEDDDEDTGEDGEGDGEDGEEDGEDEEGDGEHDNSA